MRNLLSLFFILVFTATASAQKVYFIYLQTDDYRSFYVKMNARIYSSTASGYLILPNLVDSSYTISIGFPSSQEESKFAISLNGKDRGFLIKNFDTGPGLFDLQSLTIIHPQTEDQPKNISYQKRDDNFSTLLSKAAKDTSLLYAVVKVNQDIAMKEPPVTIEEKPKTEAPVVLKNEETAVIKDTITITPPVINTNNENKKEDIAIEKKEEQKIYTVPDSASNKPPDYVQTDKESMVSLSDTYKRSVVKKHSESSTSEGFGLVFYDIDGENSDTIRLLIPNPKFTIKQTETDAPVQNQVIETGELKQDSLQHKIVVTNNPKVPITSDCKSIASENDFFRLRKNMATRPTDETMISEAKKVFRHKCFSTEQIKNLGALFLTSAGKYQFFDAAYLHVSDQENFPELQSEIKDDYYLKRFKALIGE